MGFINIHVMRTLISMTSKALRARLQQHNPAMNLLDMERTLISVENGTTGGAKGNRRGVGGALKEGRQFRWRGRGSFTQLDHLDGRTHSVVGVGKVS